MYMHACLISKQKKKSCSFFYIILQGKFNWIFLESFKLQKKVFFFQNENEEKEKSNDNYSCNRRSMGRKNYTKL